MSKLFKCLVGPVVLLTILGPFVLLPSAIRWDQSREVYTALANARSVKLVEVLPVFDLNASPPDSEIILQRIDATPAQIAGFENAVSRFLDIGIPRSFNRCFRPHHRVEITKYDGATARIEVCFECSNMQVTPGHIFRIPSRWDGPLHEFFREVGMPHRTPDEYLRLSKAHGT